MKKYITPEITLSHFETEDIVTLSGTQQTAVEQAQAAAGNIENNLNTFLISW